MLLLLLLPGGRAAAAATAATTAAAAAGRVPVEATALKLLRGGCGVREGVVLLSLCE